MTKYKLIDGERVPFTAEEETAETERQGFVELRATRDYLLSLTDFHAYSDTPTMSAEMATYRQTLRDLPSNTADPFNVTYPINPDDPDGLLK